MLAWYPSIALRALCIIDYMLARVRHGPRV
jgi:hypothetical protein